MKSQSTIPVEPSSVDDVSLAQHVSLWIAAALLGVVTAVGVWIFVKGFGVINNLTFGIFGTLPAPAGQIATALIPAIGGIVVALVMHRFSRPAKYAAMAHIIDSVAEGGGKLGVFNGFIFVIGSMIGIGVGAPVGADTPSAMIGGNLGSWLAQRLHWRTDFVRALVVAGVGAGISATYFAQLAAVFFALEVVLGGFGGFLFIVPTLIAVAFSALVTYLLGSPPLQYSIPVGAVVWNWWTLLPLLGATLLPALAAIVYVNLLQMLKKFWLGVKLPYWAKPAIAGLMVGIVGIWLPDVFGTGLTQMKTIFNGNVYPFTLLLALIIAKIILTPNSLGAGFVGGVIGPALVIGAALGAAYGDVIAHFIPGTATPPVAFAMIATAAMLAGTFHAPLFGAMMIFEMCGNYEMLLPLLFAAAIGYGVAHWFQPGSAYTFAFKGAGIQFAPRTFAVESVETPVEKQASPK